MNRLLPYLFYCFGLLYFGSPAGAQCGYTVTLHTNKDYCVGSSIIATSKHAMQQITWYRNGQSVGTATGTQSLSTQVTQKEIFSDPAAEGAGGFYNYTRIGSDDAGNIYVMYDQRLILKATPAGNLTQLVNFNAQQTGLYVSGMTVSPSGDIYVGTAADYPANFALMYKIPAGTVTASADSLQVIVPGTALQITDYPATADFADCTGNIYLYCPDYRKVFRYSPGAASATLMGNFGNIPACGGTGGSGEIRTDRAGNIFFLYGNSLGKLPAGSTSAELVDSVSCSPDNQFATDFWLDAKDTAYLSVIDFTANNGYVLKWAPGATSGQKIASFPLARYGQNYLPMTMDVQGNIWLAYSGADNLYEFKRTTSIDSAFTPTDTGTYYAVVTDIQGYTTTSDTFHVNAPTAGPPTIQISATATSTPVCTPITFTAQTTNTGIDPSFQWQVSGVPAGGDSTTYSYNLFANGDQVFCILQAQAGCSGPVADTSNIITLDIDAYGTASVTITTPKDSICLGDTAIFKATVMNGSNQPAFAWLINGDSTTDNGATFIGNGNNLVNGDVITCLITSDDACGLAKSNSIRLTVSTPPTVESGQIFTILHGHSLTLDPVTTGDIDGWRWTPAKGLSDTTIADPVADPDVNTLYTLTVTAPGGCSATGTILVNVYTPLSIPGAFTPNGDGHNDEFYVLGGPVNSQVEDFAVFNRFGAELFHAHDVAPGDRAYAWNGTFHGTPAPTGTYVYLVVMKFAGGNRQVYKGTVVLIR